MVVPSVAVFSVVVPEPPLEVLVVEAVWLRVPAPPPAPVVSLPVLVAPSVPALVLLPVVPAAFPPLVSVVLPVTEPSVAEPLVLAPEFVRLLVESGCDVDAGSAPQAASENASGTTVIDNDALYIIPPPFRTHATGRQRGVGAINAECFDTALYHAIAALSSLR